MHPEIIQYWENKGYSIRKIDNSWVLYIDTSRITAIAYCHLREMRYWKQMDWAPATISEQEMLSFVRLQAFL